MRQTLVRSKTTISSHVKTAITAHAFILPFKREETLWERNSWVFPGFTTRCKSELVRGINGTEVGYFVWTLHRRPQELVASSFAQFYRQQHQCLYVSAVPSKSRRKDNSAMLECAKEGQEFELCKYLETAKRHIFGNHRIEFGPFFPRSCRFHVQTELQIAFFSRYKSKNRAWRFGRAVFFRQRKKTVNKLTVSWRQRTLWRFKARIIRHPWPIGARVLSTSSYN